MIPLIWLFGIVFAFILLLKLPIIIRDFKRSIEDGELRVKHVLIMLVFFPITILYFFLKYFGKLLNKPVRLKKRV